MGKLEGLWVSLPIGLLLFLSSTFITVPGALAWSKEGHIMACQFAHPMYVGFTSDEGRNIIELRWFRRKSNLHRVWDRDIILQALKDYHDKDTGLLLQDIQRNYTDARLINSWAEKSIEIACKWGYEGAEPGTTLADEYFDSRMPFIMKRIAPAGVRLAMILNQVFADSEQGFESDE